MAINEQNIGQPGYDPSKPPQYIDPSQQLKDLMQQYLGNLGPSADYQGAMQGAMGAAGGKGGLDAMMQLANDPGFAKYLRGGGEAADAFATAAQKSAATGGLEGLKAIQALGGQTGTLGSTPRGLQQLDVTNKYSQSLANIEAQRAGMKEQNLQGRMGMGMQALGMVGGLGQAQYQGQVGAYTGLLNPALQQQGMQGQQTLGGMNALMGLEQFPYQQGMELWQNVHQQDAMKPRSPKLMDYLGAVAGPALSYFGGGGFGGGGTGKPPPSYGY